MAQRQAFLIANSVSYGVGSKNVSVNIVRAMMSELAEKLNSLGDYSFDTEILIDKNVSDIRQKALRKIRYCGNNDQMFLFFYFGHAYRAEDNLLYLFCKDSVDPEEPTMLKLNDIVDWIKKYAVPETVMILDCCHGGTIASQFKILDDINKYYLMASVTPKDKALVDFGDSKPFGTFSKYLIDAFGSQRAVDSPGKNVTFKSCYNFAKEMTEKRVNQTPYSSDGGLAESIFFVQKTEPFIRNGFRKDVHIKTSYAKIFCLGNFLLNNEFRDANHFYNFLSRRLPKEFLTPIKNENGDVSYELINQSTFNKYLVICEYLKIIRMNDEIRLTVNGKKMFRNDGKIFNVVLFDIIMQLWNELNISLDDLENAITSILKNGDIPSANTIWLDMYFKKKISINKYYFNLLLDLTSYVGALSYSKEKLFFVSTNIVSSSESDF